MSAAVTNCGGRLGLETARLSLPPACLINRYEPCGEAHEVKGYDALMRLHEADPSKLLSDRATTAMTFAAT